MAQKPTSSTSTHPRQRLSLYTHSTLGHDVSAALKASQPHQQQHHQHQYQHQQHQHAGARGDVHETPAPPPSPVDFGTPAVPSGAWGGSPVAAAAAVVTRRKEPGPVGA
ncbi:hypothetical protein BDY21DRAFT_363668 [Lineolata rhizophorae]|uniref:Uncharacterized protein n=1 Tax=Lineolata rhizophorae TaxID=578093 RepID=A0A6A6P033_9PEZI|nr:hypothetical protein BDY21DRAFT_363668 [Lineolata rhizophorae]